MATELDNLPDEETPLPNNPVGPDATAIKNEMMEAARDFLKANDPREQMWLAIYLDPSHPAFGNPSESVKLAYPGGSDAYQNIWAKGCSLVMRYQDKIRSWLEDCGYTEELIKLKTRRMLDAKKTQFFQKDGEVISERVTEDNQSILKALDLASKHLGMLANDKIDLGTIKIEVVNYSDRKDSKDSV